MIDLKQLVHRHAGAEIRRSRIDGIFIGLIIGFIVGFFIGSAASVIFLLTR